MNTLYVNKYPIVTMWDYDNETKKQIPKQSIPIGSIFTVESVTMNGLSLTPIDDKICLEGLILEYSCDALKLGFTETTNSILARNIKG